MQLLIFLCYLSTERRYLLSDSLNIIPFTKHKVKHFWKKNKNFFEFFEFFYFIPTFIHKNNRNFLQYILYICVRIEKN